jgi:hypothetical protein
LICVRIPYCVECMLNYISGESASYSWLMIHFVQDSCLSITKKWDNKSQRNFCLLSFVEEWFYQIWWRCLIRNRYGQEWKRLLNIFAIIVSFGELVRNLRPGLYVTIDLIVLWYDLIPKPTARSAVPGISPGRVY